MARSDVGGIRDIRNYAAQVQKLAAALSDDEAFAQQLVEAAHTGRSAEMERVLAGLHVASDVRISTVDETEPGGTEATKTRTATKTKTRTIVVTIGIGPISVSVTVKKESK